MPPRRGHLLVPSEHMSVGGHHGQQHVSSGLLEAAASPYQSPAESRHERYPPRVSRRNHQQGFHESSQYSPDIEEDDSYLESGEEDTPKKSRKVTLKARKRKGQPQFQSEHAKKLDAIPGGASFKRKCRGIVQPRPGALEYWDKDSKKWIPAVYHYQIRDKLIHRAKTSAADVYRYHRARGEGSSDVTAFLESQRDWDLERDNGWVGIEVLFMFAKLEHQGPSYEVSWLFDEGRVVLDLDNDRIKDYRDIPLTLSSEVEGALMEAIRRLDPRITLFDLWARLPKYCKGGEILTPEALNRRMGNFRLENAVAAWRTRGGSKALRQFLWDRMSPAARAANSTRELRKLSKEEQEQAQKGNAGKHATNAGGWKKDQNETTRGVSTEAHREEEGAIVPAVSRSRKNKRPQRVSVSNINGDEETWSSFYAPDSGRQPQKRRKVHEPTPSAMNVLQNSYAEPTDEDVFVDPDFRSRSGIHDHSRPFGSSAGMYDILPTEAAVGASTAYPLSHPVPNGWDRPAGFDSVVHSMGTLISPGYNSQQAVQAVQRGIAHPLVGFEYTSNDRGIQAKPWNNGPHIIPMAQYQSGCQPVGVEDMSHHHSGVNFAQRRSIEEDVEEYFLDTRLRSLANTTRPTENYPYEEIDYRNVEPRGEEDRRDIHDALAMTKSNFRLRTGNECPPTDTNQSYSDQLRQILYRFEMLWPTLGGCFPIPDLIRCQGPWRDGFASWEPPTGGDLEFVDGCFQELRAAHGRRQ